MKDIKKLMITLVALFAISTGAWAQTQWESGDCTLTLSGGVMTVSGKGAMADYMNDYDRPWNSNRNDITSLVVESGVTTVGQMAFYYFENMTSVTLPEGLTSIGFRTFHLCGKLTSVTIPSTVTSIGTDAFYNCQGVTDVNLYADPANLTWDEGDCDDFNVNPKGSTKCHVLAEHLTAYQTKFNGQVNVTFVGDLQPLASGPEVAWDKATKTGSFKMPGGNVTLEPDYYPQATAAEGAVTAADADARATTDDPLVKVDATKLTGAKKLMYFVSNSGTNAPAYDAEGWTDQLPTAEGFTQQGNVYVWYYPVGTDEGVDEATATYSDGDICLQSITARIADAPTYAVTFADGVNPEPPAEPEWTASPATDVKKGQTVTVTYTGTKKVIGVKAEKKAAAAPSVSFTVKRVGGEDPNYADGNYTVAPGTTWQQFIESGDAPACLSIGTSGIYNGKVCHDMNNSLQECGGTIIANVADKKRVKISDAIIDGATYGCSDYCDYEDHD